MNEGIEKKGNEHRKETTALETIKIEAELMSAVEKTAGSWEDSA